MTAVQADVVRPGRYDYGVGSDLRACTPQNLRSHPAISPEHSAPYPIRRLGRLKSLRVEQLSPVLAGVLLGQDPRCTGLDAPIRLDGRERERTWRFGRRGESEVAIQIREIRIRWARWGILWWTAEGWARGKLRNKCPSVRGLELGPGLEKGGELGEVEGRRQAGRQARQASRHQEGTVACVGMQRLLRIYAVQDVGINLPCDDLAQGSSRDSYDGRPSQHRL